MSPVAVERAALADPDALPLTSADVQRMRRTPQVRVIRRALDLTQEEFAKRFRIPLGTLRDWEQGRATPDQPAQGYLTVIARSPEGVQRALEGDSARSFPSSSPRKRRSPRPTATPPHPTS